MTIEEIEMMVRERTKAILTKEFEISMERQRKNILKIHHTITLSRLALNRAAFD